MSRELTIAWAKRNCPDQRVVKDVGKRLDEAEQARGHLLLLVGKQLTRSRAAYLVASLGRDMFALELTKRQARNLNVEPNFMGAVVRRSSAGMFAAAPTITLTDLHIESAGAQAATQHVVGHFSYETDAPYLPEGFALRMYYDLPDDSYASHFHHCMGPLPGRGTLKFRMSALKRPEDKSPRSLPPTLPVLFTICVQRPGCDTPDLPVSNTYAGLIDLI